MGPWNDVDITGVLSGMLIGIIAVFLSMEDKLSLKNGGRLIPIGGGLLLGLLAGLIAVWLTEPLDGCSIIKAKDSSFYLVWGTDGVLVRTVALCGLVGTILGALAQGVHAHRTSTKDAAESSREVNVPPSGQTVSKKSWKVGNAALTGAFWGGLGGALLIGLPATSLVTTVRALKGLP